MHDDPLAAPAIVGRILADDMAFIGLAAEGRDAAPELCLGRWYAGRDGKGRKAAKT